jgi:hypothetical protein
MPKKKKKKAKKRKKVTPQKNPVVSVPKTNKTDARPSKIRRIVSLVLQALGIWGVFITIWVAFTPRVFVYPRVSLDPNNPVFTYFAVRNEGYLSVRDVTVSCSAKYLILPGGTTVIGLGDYTNRFSDPKQVARVIAPGVEYSVLLPLSGLEHNKFENMDIAIVLSFRPIRWWWPRETLHRFVSTQGENGEWHWLQQPIK